MKRRPATSLPRRRADEPPASAPARSWIRALRALLAARLPALFLRFWEPTSAELGMIGETLAARHLAARGFRVLARRLATPCGELDLVARRDDLLLAVEVKSARMRRRDGAPLTEPDLRWRPGLRWRARQPWRARRALRWLCTRTPWARRSRLELIEVFVGPPHRFHCDAGARIVRSSDRAREAEGPMH